MKDPGDATGWKTDETGDAKPERRVGWRHQDGFLEWKRIGRGLVKGKGRKMPWCIE